MKLITLNAPSLGLIECDLGDLCPRLTVRARIAGDGVTTVRELAKVRRARLVAATDTERNALARTEAAMLTDLLNTESEEMPLTVAECLQLLEIVQA